MSSSEPTPRVAARCAAAARRGLLLRAAAGLLPAAALLLGGCGFALRGSTDLAFSTLAVRGQNGPLLQAIQRGIAATTNTRLVGDPRQAQAVLTVLQETMTQTATAYNADGTVAQYTLLETVVFELQTPSGQTLIAPTTLTRTSLLSYSTGAALAKAEEADLLYKGMRQALVDRMLFQLANFRPPAGVVSAPRKR